MKILCKLVLFSTLFFFFGQVKSFSRQIELKTAGLGDTVKKSSVTVQWSEDFFGSQPSTVYNHQIARIACIFSEISYIDVEKNQKDNELYYAYKKLGVEDKDIDFHYSVDYKDSVWGWNQCAFSIASKKIQTKTGPAELIFVVIRGTPLNCDEWLSNINVNDLLKKESDLHRGFSIAAEQVYKSLLEYMYRRRQGNSNTYILVTGHSRGAAAANILAAKIADNNIIEENNIYAYTFASPNVTINKEKEKYNFIYNIVNAEDVVPSVPFNNAEDWTYRKFGKTLILPNAWNTDVKKYDKEYLPKMNAFFHKFLGRDYKPFRTGPFIPVTITNVLTSLNENVEHYYTGSYALHQKFTDLFKKIFPDNSNGNEQTEGSGSLPMGLINWLSEKTNGLTDYAADAFYDMHACETYLAWMLALDQDEAFSSLGYSQITISGHEDVSVMDKENNILAKARDGMIIYSKNHLPAAACSLPGKIAIGLPANQDFTITVGNESLIPTKAKFQIDSYNADGTLKNSGEEKTLRPSYTRIYTFTAGKESYQKNESMVKITKGEKAVKLYVKAGLEDEEPVKFAPEITFDTDAKLGFGTRILYKNLFISMLTEVNLTKDTSFSLIPGLGKQSKLISGLYGNFDIFAKCFWNLSSSKSQDNSVFNLIPSIRFSFSFQPIHRFQFFAAAIFDFNINGFNDGAFDDNIRKKTITSIPIGDNLDIYPVLQAGIRF